MNNALAAQCALLAATLAIAALTTSVAPAQSAPEGGLVIIGTIEPQHCIARVVSGQPPVVRCFRYFRAAIAAATNNTVLLPSGVTQQSISDVELFPTPAATTAVIGIDYDGIDYTGDTLIWYVNRPYGCYEDPFAYTISSQMPNLFNNRLSSTRAFNGCHFNDSYDGYNYTGASVRCFRDCTRVGVMNNRTSSKVWWDF